MQHRDVIKFAISGVTKDLVIAEEEVSRLKTALKDLKKLGRLSTPIDKNTPMDEGGLIEVQEAPKSKYNAVTREKPVSS